MTHRVLPTKRVERLWNMRFGAVALFLFWWVCALPARGELVPETFSAEAPVPNAPKVLLFVPLATTVDLDLEFFSIEQVIVHATFAENLLDPEETLYVTFGISGIGVSPTEPVDQISVDVTSLSQSRAQLMNGLGAFSVSVRYPGSVLLSSLLVEVRGTPLPDAEAILTCTEDWSDGGTLYGLGAGNSGPGRLNAFQNMIDTAGSMVDEGNPTEACDELHRVLARADGQFSPPDFVAGESVADVVELIESLRRELRCDVISWGFEAEVTSTRDPLFSVGDVWTGTITYEPSTPDSSTHNLGAVYAESVLEAQLTHEETSVILEPVRRERSGITVSRFTGFPGSLGMTARNATVWQGGEVVATFPQASFGLHLRDFNEAIFADTSLPLVPPALSDLEWRYLDFKADGGNESGSFYIRSLFLIPAPAL